MLLKRLGYLARSPYTYLATFLNIVLVVLGAWLHSVSPTNQTLYFVSLVLILLAIGLIDIIIKAIHDRKQAYKVYESVIHSLLDVAAVAMLKAANPTKDSIRVNVMLLEEDQRRLTIHYAYGFSGSDRDRFINIPINTGCAGLAFLHCNAYVANATELFSATPAHWGLPPSEVEKIRPSLKSIFSIPIRINNNQCIGVLNFDSDNTIEEMKFSDEGVQLIAFSFADALAVLLQQSP